ncbi:MAG: hypothetical protein JXR37_32485 [Kiritimatiellae bacterium]|nr:hypothetical protein [Kiritimatiellia bacterium]
MRSRIQTHRLLTAAAAVAIPLAAALGAGQSSADFTVAADVFTAANTGSGVGSAAFQMSVSVGQRAVAAEQTAGGDFALEAGFQAASEGFDSDCDGIADADDPDADGDGIADAVDPRPYDTDEDGENNVTDADDDGDGLTDEQEWLFGTSRVEANTDGDAHDDYQEWIAGTSGTDSGSVFEVSALDKGTGDSIEIQWQGVAGRTYEVQSATNLVGTGVVWNTESTTNVTASGPITYGNPSPPVLHYYRITVGETP